MEETHLPQERRRNPTLAAAKADARSRERTQELRTAIPSPRSTTALIAVLAGVAGLVVGLLAGGGSDVNLTVPPPTTVQQVTTQIQRTTVVKPAPPKRDASKRHANGGSQRSGH